MGRMIDADALKEKFPLPPEMWEMKGQQTLWHSREIREAIDLMPTVEPLTDKEQRIFLAAMGREEKVCKEVDRNYVREPYEDSLMRVCKEIRRKVKGALWT